MWKFIGRLLLGEKGCVNNHGECFTLPMELKSLIFELRMRCFTRATNKLNELHLHYRIQRPGYMLPEVIGWC